MNPPQVYMCSLERITKKAHPLPGNKEWLHCPLDVILEQCLNKPA